MERAFGSFDAGVGISDQHDLPQGGVFAVQYDAVIRIRLYDLSVSCGMPIYLWAEIRASCFCIFDSDNNNNGVCIGVGILFAR